MPPVTRQRQGKGQKQRQDREIRNSYRRQTFLGPKTKQIYPHTHTHTRTCLFFASSSIRRQTMSVPIPTRQQSQAQAILILRLEHFGIAFVAEEDSEMLRQLDNRALLDQVVAYVRQCPPLQDATEDNVLHALDMGRFNPASAEPDTHFWCIDPIDVSETLCCCPCTFGIAFSNGTIDIERSYNCCTCAAVRSKYNSSSFTSSVRTNTPF
jgi:hypothetical protein